MADQDEPAKLWKVNRTIHELVKDRVWGKRPMPVCGLTFPPQGFQVADDEISMDLAVFKQHYASHAGTVECVLKTPTIRVVANRSNSRSQLNFFTNHQNNPMEQIYVFFTEERSVGVKTMRKCVIISFGIESLYTVINAADFLGY